MRASRIILQSGRCRCPIRCGQAERRLFPLHRSFALHCAATTRKAASASCRCRMRQERAQINRWPEACGRSGLGWRTASPARHVSLDVDSLGDAQRVFKFDAEILHRAVDLRMAQQQLDRTEIAGLAIDFGRLRASKRMRAVPARCPSSGFFGLLGPFCNGGSGSVSVRV